MLSNREHKTHVWCFGKNTIVMTNNTINHNLYNTERLSRSSFLNFLNQIYLTRNIGIKFFAFLSRKHDVRIYHFCLIIRVHTELLFVVWLTIQNFHRQLNCPIPPGRVQGEVTRRRDEWMSAHSSPSLKKVVFIRF